jgi:hypothetical protein
MPPKVEAAAVPAGKPASGLSAAPASANRPVAGKIPDKVAEKAGDFYGERAKEVLAEEQKTAIKLNPLQIAAPDYDVLICEAGCQNGPGILAKRLKVQSPSATADRGTNDRFISQKSAECRGGCYDSGPRLSGLGMGRSALTPRVLGGEAGTWMTTVTPEKSAAAAPAKPAPGAKKGLRDDWMARINRERSTDQPSSEPAASTKADGRS